MVLANKTLMVVGDQAAGKSETCNSLFGSQVFPTSSNTTPVTRGVDRRVATHLGRDVTLLDTEGVPNPEADKDTVLGFLSNIEYFMISTPQGINVFLLVYRFEAGFGAKELGTLATLKNTFGQSAFGNFGVLIVTGLGGFQLERSDLDNSGQGDQVSTLGKARGPEDDNTSDFRRRNKDALDAGGNGQDNHCSSSYQSVARIEDPFIKWCYRQTGVFKDLFLECKGRAVNFDNKTQDERRMQFQINKLMSIVDAFSNDNIYTIHTFSQARSSRDLMRVMACKADMQRKVEESNANILKRLNDVLTKVEAENRSPLLDNLKQETEGLMVEINREDNGTGIFQDLLNDAKLTAASVQNAIIVNNYVAVEFEGIRRREASLEQTLRDQIKNLRDDMHRSHEQILILVGEIRDEVESNSYRQQREFQAEFDTRLRDEETRLREKMARQLSKHKKELRRTTVLYEICSGIKSIALGVYTLTALFAMLCGYGVDIEDRYDFDMDFLRESEV